MAQLYCPNKWVRDWRGPGDPCAFRDEAPDEPGNGNEVLDAADRLE